MTQHFNTNPVANYFAKRILIKYKSIAMEGQLSIYKAFQN